MKKNVLLFTLVACMGYVVFSSNANGPGLVSSENRTGAKATTTNCESGCHNNTLAAPAPTINIRVDTFGGVEVFSYTPGKAYTVTVTGAHATMNRFGFQFAAVSGMGSSQVLAGLYSGLPTGVAQRTPGGLALLEQTSSITGGISFTKSFTWTAPLTNVGNVTMYLTVNAVNGDLNTSGDVSANMNKVLMPKTTAVPNVTSDISLTAFPNPVTDVLHIHATNIFGSYTVQAFDMAGHSVLNTTVTGIATISTANWAIGIYNVVVTGETDRKTIQVVKQ